MVKRIFGRLSPKILGFFQFLICSDMADEKSRKEKISLIIF